MVEQKFQVLMNHTTHEGDALVSHDDLSLSEAQHQIKRIHSLWAHGKAQGVTTKEWCGMKFVQEGSGWTFIAMYREIKA